MFPQVTTRQKRIMTSMVGVLLVAGMILSLATQKPGTMRASLVDFPDVPPTHPAYTAITQIRSLGIMTGYPDGTFHPDATIIRAEMAKILTLASGKQASAECVSPVTAPFPDVSTQEWFASPVCQAKNRGVILGYPDGMFRPGNTIDFVEVAAMVARAFGAPQDPQANPWYAPSVSFLADHQAIPPDIQAIDQYPTRGDIAQIIAALTAGSASPAPSLASNQPAQNLSQFQQTVQDMRNLILQQAQQSQLHQQQTQNQTPYSAPSNYTNQNQQNQYVSGTQTSVPQFVLPASGSAGGAGSSATASQSSASQNTQLSNASSVNASGFPDLGTVATDQELPGTMIGSWNGNRPDISYDGADIVYENENSKISVYNREAGTETVIGCPNAVQDLWRGCTGYITFASPKGGDAWRGGAGGAFISRDKRFVAALAHSEQSTSYDPSDTSWLLPNPPTWKQVLAYDRLELDPNKRFKPLFGVTSIATLFSIPKTLKADTPSNDVPATFRTDTLFTADGRFKLETDPPGAGGGKLIVHDWTTGAKDDLLAGTVLQGFKALPEGISDDGRYVFAEIISPHVSTPLEIAYNGGTNYNIFVRFDRQTKAIVQLPLGDELTNFSGDGKTFVRVVVDSGYHIRVGTIPDSVGGSSASGGGGQSSSGRGTTCSLSDCGPRLGMASFVCPDGTIGGPTGQCLRGSTGICSWEIHQCSTAASSSTGGASQSSSASTVSSAATSSTPSSSAPASSASSSSSSIASTINDPCIAFPTELFSASLAALAAAPYGLHGTSPDGLHTATVAPPRGLALWVNDADYAPNAPLASVSSVLLRPRSTRGRLRRTQPR